MKYKIEAHIRNEVEFIVYQIAPNGEVCRRIASCLDKKDAENIASLLNDREACKEPTK